MRVVPVKKPRICQVWAAGKKLLKVVRAAIELLKMQQNYNYYDNTLALLNNNKNNLLNAMEHAMLLNAIEFIPSEHNIACNTHKVVA